VDIDDKNSVLFDLLLGTVQGSILRPVLCAIFVFSLFKEEKHDNENPLQMSFWPMITQMIKQLQIFVALNFKQL
jgi:hypothetical protein